MSDAEIAAWIAANVHPSTWKGLLGVWAIGACAIVPFAFGWDRWAGPWDEGGRPKFDGTPLAMAVVLPAVPFALASLIVVGPALYVLFALPAAIARWWNADWSRSTPAR